MTQKVALIGRPNVGKSTLFNRLVGRKTALVLDVPGLTRDRRYGDGKLADLQFEVIDTPGVEETGRCPAHELSEALLYQTHAAIQESTLILLVIDAKDGVLVEDQVIARLVRKSGKPCILVLNKAETKASSQSILEAATLGFSEMCALSAEHGEGFSTLYDLLRPYCSVDQGEEDVQADERKPIGLAIVGRPNVGKSTLINALVGSERFTVGATAGTTRDALSISLEWEGIQYKVSDTAGLRKRSKVSDPIEKLSRVGTEKAVQYAEVVILVVDALSPLDRQDLVLAHRVVEEGRALIICVNKIDKVDDLSVYRAKLEKDLKDVFPVIKKLPLVFVSAQEKKNLAKIFLAVKEVYAQWNQRLSTGGLNKWLAQAIEAHPPPLSKGRRIKIKYVTQIKRRPPTFLLFTTRAGDLPESYIRYLRNSLAEFFNLEKIPLRLSLRQKENPFSA